MPESQKKRPWCDFSARFRDEPLHALREELDDLRCRLFGSAEEGRSSHRLSPALDVSETAWAIEVSLDVPGVQAEGIDVRINGQSLRICGQRPEPRDDEERQHHQRERQWGRFERTVALPCPVDEEQTTARYHDGVLTITLPKCEETGSRKVRVELEPGGGAPGAGQSS